MKILFAMFFSLLLPFIAFAEDGKTEKKEDKIQKAVDIVKSLCLSGQQYDIEADAKGNITIKSFKPGAEGRMSINVKEADGAVALQEDLRLIGDREIRECTSQHINRIIDAVLEEAPPAVSHEDSDNIDFRRAKYVGFVPQTVSFAASVSSSKPRYFRFSLKENCSVSFEWKNLLQWAVITIYDADKNRIFSESPFTASGARALPLLTGDYYMSIGMQSSNTATPVYVTIVGEPQ